MTIRLAIRGYLGDTLVFERALSTDEESIDALVEEHTWGIVEGNIDMLEFEFLDEPDPFQRFLRLGTNTQRMAAPMRLKL